MHMINRKKHLEEGQVTMEYMFCLIVVMILMYGVFMAFRWVGVELANRRIQYDKTITANVADNWKDIKKSPLKQLSPNFYQSGKMNLIFK